jgi:hypothetical protein
MIHARASSRTFVLAHCRRVWAWLIIVKSANLSFRPYILPHFFVFQCIKSLRRAIRSIAAHSSLRVFGHRDARVSAGKIGWIFLRALFGRKTRAANMKRTLNAPYFCQNSKNFNSNWCKTPITVENFTTFAQYETRRAPQCAV